jgi:sugar-specific transcriptional regulator TrmB
MDEKILEEIGLSKNEIKVYLALLKIGKTTSLRIINETGISVSALYYCLENLVKKGLASYSVMANKKNFQATPPEQLVSLLETKKQKLEEIIPELKSMQKESDEQIQTNVYEDYKGIKGIYDRILRVLKKRDVYYVIGARQIGDSSNETTNALLTNFHRHRDKNRINVKIIFNKDVKDEVEKVSKKFKFMDSRFMDIKTNSVILIYDNRVINFLFTKKLIATETVSKEVYNSYIQFFNEMWKIAKK